MPPPPLAASTPAKAWLRSKGPKKLVSMCSRADATLLGAKKPPVLAMPALLISSVTSASSAATRATSAGLVTSSFTGMTPGSVTEAGSRAPAYTLRAPRASASLAKAKPRPRLAPVMRTTALSSFMVMPFCSIYMMIIIYLGQKIAIILDGAFRETAVSIRLVVLSQQALAICLEQSLALRVVAKGTGQLQGAHHGAGNHQGCIGCRAGGQCLLHQFDHALHPQRRCVSHLRGLARHFGAQGGHGATMLGTGQVGIGQVRLD